MASNPRPHPERRRTGPKTEFPDEATKLLDINETVEKHRRGKPLSNPLRTHSLPLQHPRTGAIHASGPNYVNRFVGLYRLIPALLAVSAFAADPALDTLLKNVETRYNKAKTLQVFFHEDYKPAGRPKRSESGALQLRKPGKMRWDYTQPAGKFFLSDGKQMWIYTPADNRVVQMKLKESDDMHVLLAFLLGKLDFSKEFRNIQAKPEGASQRITAEPKSENMPYTNVEFLVGPQAQIQQLKAVGFDKSTMEFRFDEEKVDLPIDAKLFTFTAPKGAEVVQEAR
jgi:outer membrane lipoprotein carrier protein